ncbi:hypothetical protein A4S05_28870 [Nostoc sp. KVJ20]|uniref:effector-associated domain EAD1-containing protein n=1 Tax=Nostoc sp. KVJ20 TaxID=457944 RepID=UPI00083D9B2C|nr:effector-associated domain EAD1-containing protein [Nostoc sp. KVJ20]ODH01471.1 hypothetical protein A4S05_28870 [Nostoc sp. KVJ20]
MESDNKKVIELLQEQLDYFRREYIITADPSRKFELSKRIEEIEKQLQASEDRINTSKTKDLHLVIDNSKPINLTGSQRKEFREALMDAFRSKNDLEIMLSEELDWNLDQIAGGNNYQDIVFNLIKFVEAKGEIKKLLEAAKLYNSGNYKLHNFYVSIINS